MLRYRGILGLFIIAISEVLLFSGVQFVAEWFTPIIWTGYIMLMDEVNHRMAGWSLMMDRRREFVLMIPLSIICWAVFEVYNLNLKNWQYINLPENVWIRYIGYGVSFATIFPGIFETSIFLDNSGIFRRLKSTRSYNLRPLSGTFITAGAICLLLPLFLPVSAGRYLFGLVWIGFIFLLEPINYRLGLRSLMSDWDAGDRSMLAALMAAGAICGVLWEFWNYWAWTKWIYILPFPVGFKIFEMPAIGFLGFLPFAVECYAMFNFCAMRRETRG
jgi:hypothetical protein